MKMISLPKLVLAGVALLACQTLLAGTVVRQLDADTLSITRYQGKPPHERSYVKRSQDTAKFELYQAQVGIRPLPLFAVESRGAPGKSISRIRQRISSDIGELTELAVFEETSGEAASNNGRAWRGPPGKGLRSGR